MNTSYVIRTKNGDYTYFGDKDQAVRQHEELYSEPITGEYEDPNDAILSVHAQLERDS